MSKKKRFETTDPQPAVHRTINP